jgi:hypothetical protein
MKVPLIKMGDKNDLSVRNSRKLYFPVYSMSIILLLAVAFLNFKGYTINRMAFIIIGVFALSGIIGGEIHRFGNKYKITSSSVIHIEGYFNTNAKRIDLSAISDVDVSQTLWQRLLDFGDVKVHLFSAESTTPIKNINHPEKFADILEQKMNEIGGSGGGFKRNA